MNKDEIDTNQDQATKSNFRTAEIKTCITCDERSVETNLNLGSLYTMHDCITEIEDEQMTTQDNKVIKPDSVLNTYERFARLQC